MTVLSMSTAMVMAQSKVVTGRVISDEDGEPIIGASIIIPGTSTGTVTDVDGNFSITIPQDAKAMQVSYVGMTSQTIAPQNKQMIIVLKTDDKILEETVVTALGISKEKKTLGYAVQDIKADVLNQASQLNVANALQGKVSGVQITQAGGAVGASQRILIRGNSSFNSNDPLIVIDGVPMDGGATSDKMDGAGHGTLDTGSGLNDINPDDIESISVLKGGSAALYGMRAGNGVILITTKKGKSQDGKMKISYDGSFTVDHIYHLPKYQNKYGQGWGGSEYDWKTWGSDYATYAEFAENEGYYYVDGTGNGINDGDDESWGPRLDIGLMLPQYNSPVVNGVRQATPWVSHPSNIKDFFETGYSQSHNLSIENSSAKGNYRLSMGYRNQSGTVPNTDQTRYNAIMSGTYNFNKYVSVDATMQYSITHSDNLMLTGYSAGNPLQSIMQWFGRQVDMKDLKKNWNTQDADGNYYNWMTAFHVNPYFNMNRNTNSYDRNRFIGKASVWIKPTDYLKFEGRIGYDYYNDGTFQQTLYHTDCPNGWFGETTENQHELNLDLIGYYNDKFGAFTVDVIAGANYRDMLWKYDYLGANPSYGLTVPGLYTMGNVVGVPSTDMDHSHIRSNSVFSNAALGWKSQLFVEGSLRNDWSSTIKDSFFYPSISLSWIPTSTWESLQSDVMSYLKIRANIAKVGNATSAYRTQYYMTPVGTTINGNAQYYRGNTLLNPELKPESITTKELGIEAAFWKNRVRLDLAVYDKTTTDQIMTVEVPVSSGYGYKLINAGKVSNRGVELSLNVDIIKTRDFLWTSTLNWSKDKSEIKELTDGIDKYTITSNWSCYNYAEVGGSWGSLYGVGFDLDDKGRVQVDEDGMPLVTAESIKIGDVTPDWLAGWSNEFTYKGFNLGFLLDYRKGGDFFSVSQLFGAVAGNLNFTAAGDIRENGLIVGKDVLANRTVVKAGTDELNDIVLNAYDYFNSYYTNKELDICDGSFLKLREVHFSWNLPKKWLTASKVLSSAKLSVVGSNVGILWLSSRNQTKIDPESTLGSGNSSVGFESNSCPPTRSWGVKLNLVF